MLASKESEFFTFVSFVQVSVLHTASRSSFQIIALAARRLHRLCAASTAQHSTDESEKERCWCLARAPRVYILMCIIILRACRLAAWCTFCRIALHVRSCCCVLMCVCAQRGETLGLIIIIMLCANAISIRDARTNSLAFDSWWATAANAA